MSALFLAMDLFMYWPNCKVLIRWEREYESPPDGFDHVGLCGHRGPATVAKKLLSQPNKPLMDLRGENMAIPAHKIDAHPSLDLLLNRIIEHDWLRNEFIDTSASGKIVWDQRAVCS